MSPTIHPLEDLPARPDSVNDNTESRGEEDHAGGGTGDLRGTLDGNSNISLLEGRGVVNSVTGHGNQVASALEGLDDLVLVLREDLGESVSVLNVWEELKEEK